jgi:hypothetical protein
MSVATEEEIASRPIAVIGSGTGRGSCCNAMSMAARWVSNQTAVSTTTTPVNNKTDGDRYPAPLSRRLRLFSEWVTTVPFCLYDSKATFCVWLASYQLEVRNEEVFILLRHHA